jgi:hypothetical protein
MKLQKNNRPIYKNSVAWLIAIVIVLLVLVTLEKTNVIDFIKAPTGTTQGPTPKELEQEASVDAAKKKDFIENTPKTDQPTSTSVADASIEINARQEANNTVTVFTKLYGYSSGTCELVITNGTKITTQTANAMYQPEFSSCEGFSAPIDPLGKGAWTIKLSVTSAGTTKDKTISFEVM